MALAKEWLAKHPVDGEMHAWYAFFLKKQGDFQGYFRHMHFYQGLLASITSSGTGLSAESPMKVISVSEEYTVLRALDAKRIRQALMVNEAGAPCDQMVCEMDGEELTLYFDVTLSMEHTAKMLGVQEGGGALLPSEVPLGEGRATRAGGGRCRGVGVAAYGRRVLCCV